MEASQAGQRELPSPRARNNNSGRPVRAAAALASVASGSGRAAA